MTFHFSAISDMSLYHFANQEILQQCVPQDSSISGMLTPLSKPNLVQQTEDPDTLSQFAQMLASSSLIHMSTSFQNTTCDIRNSIIQKNVVMGPNVKIIRSIIMQKVNIGDDVMLVDCFVGPKAQIGNNQTIKDAIIN